MSGPPLGPSAKVRHGLLRKSRFTIERRNGLRRPVSTERSILEIMKCRTSATCFFLTACAAFGQAIGMAHAQSTAPAPRPEFEVASVKPCRDTDTFNGGSSSPGRFTISCLPVMTLISMAYIEFGSGRRDPFSTTVIEGAPAWIGMSESASNWYAVDARAVGAASEEIMRGPMMQALLEDRFKLKVHRETRNVRIYALTVNKGGAKLKPFDGSCTQRDYTKAQAQADDGQKALCAGSSLTRGGQTTMDLHGISMAAFADTLGSGLERRGIIDGPIIDRTGLTGRFDFHLEFSSSANPAAVSSADGPDTVFNVLQDRLGLKLEPSTGPREFIVIDHIERASEN